jgi:pSer/pThr/pTyr-binding forkhead associated (FHA) protein
VTMDFLDNTAKAFGEVYATLTVLGSDDTAMLGKVLNIIKSPSRLGRSAECDIILPKDNPVSRMHALIELSNNQVIIREILTPDSSGSPKKPTYGTFVNGKKVEDEPVVLNTADLLQIGPRVKFRFDLLPTTPVREEKTFDHFNPGDPEGPVADQEHSSPSSEEAVNENTLVDVEEDDPERTLQDANNQNINKPDDPVTHEDTEKTALD